MRFPERLPDVPLFAPPRIRINAPDAPVRTPMAFSQVIGSLMMIAESNMVTIDGRGLGQAVDERRLVDHDCEHRGEEKQHDVLGWHFFPLHEWRHG